ncbi:Crp/Fnr family transcriptional regulator [Maribellus sp. YY47]|uniref:Crp/Fnr family transcriptional regulator n=1 Tax=Maribellus sp. YY47 TaxID=2929486 RepID=UPI002001AD72|nr:Crp/Fnr family transcriptional regulator [Maribellus sp. YY47]MCK3684288.1 Crp/Fnr family transcriptional regulator [Maribellus sp. YY47]
MIKEYFKSFDILSPEELELPESLLQPKTLKKGDFFIKAGSVCKEVAFVSSGFFRSFYLSSSGEEVTYCLLFNNSFVTAYSSFITQTATEENIQALADVEMMTISKQAVEQLENTSPNWMKIMKMIAEREYINLEKRIFLLQRENAEKRYHDLLNNYPEYLKLIPLNYLASYLGITQRHLSRLRRSVAN